MYPAGLDIDSEVRPLRDPEVSGYRKTVTAAEPNQEERSQLDGQLGE
jgi:hypothetical protein